MITLQKSPNKDFKILNLADVQMGNNEWQVGHKFRAILDTTLDALYEKVKPDLVTLSGDQAWCGDYDSLETLASKLDTYGVPYALVWGNHDQEGGADKVIGAENTLKKHPLFLYESGPSELGFGNYIIAINEGNKPVHALIMMDSHDHAHYYDKDGKEVFAWGTTPAWGKLYPEQLVWYKEQIEQLKAAGYPESTIIMHIPCYAYNTAFNASFKGETTSITIADSYKSEYWTDEAQGAFGVKYEGICSYPADEGAFDAISECNHTKTVLVGHDHKNCFSVPYKGVRLTFAVKTGAGCYWTPEMNGGTSLTVNSQGVITVEHNFVDVSNLL